MTLRKGPAIDSADLADARRREFDIPRERAVFLGVSALKAAREGRYVSGEGHEVDWKAAVEKALAAKVSLPPDAPLPGTAGPQFPETHVVVANETTLAAARRLFAVTDWSPERKFLGPFRDAFSLALQR